MISPAVATHGPFIQRAASDLFLKQQGPSLVIKRLPVTGVTYEKWTYNIWTREVERAGFVYESLCFPGSQMRNGEKVDMGCGEDVLVVVREESMAEDWREARGEGIPAEISWVGVWFGMKRKAKTSWGWTLKTYVVLSSASSGCCCRRLRRG